MFTDKSTRLESNTSGVFETEIVTGPEVDTETVPETEEVDMVEDIPVPTLLLVLDTTLRLQAQETT